ncbi:MAG: sodium:calcium antiporter [Candidatus Brockarchaeota archaeon]|nr:sodium:calcium antiporter [Candidatus Brockarchaeota archaeon]
MDMLVEPLIIMAISLLGLLVSSHIAIRNAVKVSEITGLEKSRIGFTFIATSTSLPELAVAIFSTISGEGAVSVGNVLGSNISNICLIIGIGLILYSLKPGRRGLEKINFKPEELDMLYLGIFTASVIPILLISFLPATKIVGLLLIIIYIYYSFEIISKKKLPPEENSKEIEAMNLKEKKKLFFYLIFSFLGIIGVIISADFLVDATIKIALLAGISPYLISATIIAVGTSFPELFLDVQAMLREHTTLAFGDVIGSCFTNITLILGVTLLFSPVRISIEIFSDLVTFSILANIILWYLMHRGKLSFKEGFLLLLLYVLFLASIMGIVIFPE